MKIRAVIFDVYGTLLRVGPPPPDAGDRWNALFEKVFHSSPPMAPLDFSVACNRAIQSRHRAAQTVGIPHPEILWPGIVEEVLPPVARLPAETRANFIFEQIQMGRTISLMPHAAPVLRRLALEKRLLGLASNAQAYTLRELTTQLQAFDLSFNIFDPQLCYWSFQHGFSKPDPHVFQLFAIRLEARGIRPAETLMVGDRIDNDINPARACGFQTWQLSAPTDQKGVGDWQQLGEFLTGAL